MQFLIRCLALALTMVSLSGAFAANAEPAATVDRLFAEALGRGEAKGRLNELVARFPGRFSGTETLRGAEQWAAEQFRAIGLADVRLQAAQAPNWTRGTIARCVAEAPGTPPLELAFLAIGGSVGTPVGGVRAEVLRVETIDQLRALDSAKVRGRIVFCDARLDASLSDTFEAYRRVSDTRRRAAALGGELGALAVLVRSMTTAVDDAPHTGSMTYDTGKPQIPAAALSTLAANRLTELMSAGRTVEINLEMDCRPLPDATVHNVIGELRGTEFPEKILLIGAHLDSWDVSPGAHDDGAGIVQVMEVFRMMKALGLKPRHTWRAVLFANEEFGKAGAIKYLSDALAAGEEHFLAIESDVGGFAPIGLQFGSLRGDLPARAARWRPILEPHGLYRFEPGEGGPDLRAMQLKGIPVAGLITQSHRYFDLHHTPLDTLDQINERELHAGAAALACLAWLADQDGL
ncbi:M28 family peptidase [Opitutaceae bacterium]